MCAPSATVTDSGEVQAAKAPASTAHSKVAPPSSAENAKLAPVAPVGSAGPLSTVVVGAVVSTVQA